MFLDSLRTCIQGGDYIKFSYGHETSSNTDDVGYGMPLHCSEDQLFVRLFQVVTSEILKRYFIQPVNATDYPLACLDEMEELYLTTDEIYISRSDVTDILFVVPIAEVESGMFSMSGASNVYFIRYKFLNGEMHCFPTSFYFSRYIVEPLGVRLFNVLNTLSQHLRRALSHVSESSPTKKTFRLYLFTMEAFWYLVYRVGKHAVGTSCYRKQSVIKYYNTLRMECCSKLNTLSYLRVLSEPALHALRQVLGLGTGLGISKKRPTKANPLQHCTIGCIMTAVEVGPDIPYEVLLKPDCSASVDGIDFVYSEQNRCLSTTIRFTKVVVHDEHVATSRIASAEVLNNKDSGIYLSVWFKYGESLLEVTAIDEDNNKVTCSYVDELSDNIELPINVVSELVAKFGQG